MFKPPRALSDSCGRGSFFDNHVKTSKMVFKFLQTCINHADFRKFFRNLNFGGSMETDIQEQDKNKATNDKTKHGMEKSKPKSAKVRKSTPTKVKSQPNEENTT
ncbi:hypothetical protein Tco_1429132 [Tanacetum coccineum]